MVACRLAHWGAHSVCVRVRTHHNDGCCAAVVVGWRLPVVGDRVFYWRHEGTTKMPGKAKRSGRWRGPALVVAIEPGVDIRPRTIWISHATTLLRCALEQLRPDYDAPHETDIFGSYDDVDHHLKQLRRGASRYDDLMAHRLPDDNGDDTYHDPNGPDYDDPDFDGSPPDDDDDDH